MQYRPCLSSRRRNQPVSSRALGHDTTTVLLVLQCVLLFLLVNCNGIAAAESAVTPFVHGRHVAFNERMNHERRNSLLRSNNEEPLTQRFHSEVAFWNSRRALQSAACSAHPQCAAAGLVNDCCPTAEGVFLGCCDDNRTPAPVAAPMNASVPTGPPTRQPIAATNSPTVSPVRSPTPPPATAAPQPLPTTNRPTRPPTLPPVSRAPVTPPPTERPITASPVERPVTTSPSTRAPVSLAPVTMAPSFPGVTASPTARGSEAPSATPSAFYEYNVTALAVSDVRLSLKRDASSRLRRLQDDNCTQFLKDAIVDRMEEEIVAIIQTYESLLVEIQNFTAAFTNTSLATYIFDVLLEVRSPMQEYEPNRYVEGPFDSQVEKNLFAETLRTTDCPEFADVVTVDVVVPRKVEDKSPSESDESALSVGLLAGIVAAAAALMMVVGAIFILSRKRRRMILDDDSSHHRRQLAAAKSTFEMEANEYEFSEIDGGNFNTGDISTLGDPSSSGTKSRGKDTENGTLDSKNAEYDFKKAFLDVQSVTDSQLFSEDVSPRRRIATLDDPSLMNGGSTSDIVTAAGDTQCSPRYTSEEQFDVVAPAGVLGLIIESSLTDGRPVVHNIKPTSPLAHVVHVGDRLVAMDGVVVSALRASDVSRLIAEKKDKSRLLVFSRPMNV